MFEPVPELTIEAELEIGDVDLEAAKSESRDTSSYISRNKRIFPYRTRNEERKMALGFFLQRLYFLGHKETACLFRCIDSIKSVPVTKKNNVIVAPYIVLLTIASKGYKLTSTLLEMFFPELYGEHSKRFKFEAQIKLIQEQLGYSSQESYYSYEFETYYATIALIIRTDTDNNIFDTRTESPIIVSLSEITYRLYVIYLRNDSIQWSVNNATVINQMVNIVLVTLYDLILQAVEDGKVLKCRLARDHELPFDLLIERKDKLETIITRIRSCKSFVVNKRDIDILTSYCMLVEVNS